MGRKILISLVGDQTIPNVLFMKNSNNYSRYVFLTTEEMEEKDKVDHIMKGAEIDNNNVEKLIVPEDNPEEIVSILSKMDMQDDDEFHVNLTGGTKIMTIGAYLFFRDRNSKMFYIPIGKQECIKLFPKMTKNKKPIDYRLNLTEYLNSNGVSFKKGSPIKEIDHTKKMLKIFLNDPSLFTQDMYVIRTFKNKGKLKKTVDKNKIPKEVVNKIEKYISDEGLNYIKKNEIDYLIGGWFEELIYNMLKSTGKVSDENIAIGVNMFRSESQNEFDVMFTKDNALYVVECKTGLKTTGGKSILSETLYKLDSLKKDFGLYVKAFIVTLEDIRDKEGNIRKAYKHRADFMGITIVDRKDFKDGVSGVLEKLLD
jgi:hypothetical protein